MWLSLSLYRRSEEAFYSFLHFYPFIVFACPSSFSFTSLCIFSSDVLWWHEKPHGGFFNELGATPEKVFIILIEAFIAGWLPSGLPDVSLFTMVKTDHNVLLRFSSLDSLFSKRWQTLRNYLQKLEGPCLFKTVSQLWKGTSHKCFKTFHLQKPLTLVLFELLETEILTHCLISMITQGFVNYSL